MKYSIILTVFLNINSYSQTAKPFVINETIINNNRKKKTEKDFKNKTQISLKMKLIQLIKLVVENLVEQSNVRITHQE